MKIYYLKKDKFLNTVSRESLEKYSDKRVYGSEEKYLEHLCGIYLTKYVAHKFFNMSDTTIAYDNGKPYFTSGKVCFSLSHSKNIVLAGFCEKNIGVDVEFMAPRNTDIYNKILERYSTPCKNPTTEDFYKLWTVHEAKIKLRSHPKSTVSMVLEQDYMLSCVTEDENINAIEILKEIEIWT